MVPNADDLLALEVEMDGTFLLISLDRLFNDGGPLPEPFGDCGGDPTPDGLGWQGSCP